MTGGNAARGTGESAQEALRDNDVALRMVMSQMPAIFWTVDRDLRFTGAMGAGRKLLAEESRSVEGLSLFAYFKTTDATFEPIAAHRRALEGEASTYETTWQGRVFQSHVEPFRNDAGQVAGVLGIAFDVTEHKQAEEKLRRSISLLNATIDATADAILVVDVGGRMVNFNRRFVEMWGIPEDVAESRDEARALASILDRLAEPAAFVKKVMSVYAQPESPSHDVIEMKDGRLIERDSRPQVVDGKAVGRVWSFRDVTERRHAEEGIEHALSLLKATLEATADGILVVDNAGAIVSYNRKFAEMWRIPEDVLIARDDKRAQAFVLNQLRDPERFVRKVQEVYGEPEARSYDWLEFKDGRMFERYSAPQKVAGRTVGRVWSFHDVTRIRLMEDTIRRHARAFDHISDAVLTLDLEARIVDWNPGAEKMFGYSKAEMTGRTPDLLRPKGTTATSQDLLASMRRDGRWSGETRFVRKDGNPGVCATVVVPLFDDFGRILAALAVCRDLADRKSLEEYRRRESSP